MKMRIVILLILFVFAPQVSFAQSTSEDILRQQLIALILQLQAEIAGRSESNSVNQADIKSASLDGLATYRYTGPRLTFTEYTEDLELTGIDGRSWMILSGEDFVGSFDLGNQATMDGLDLAFAMFNLAGLFSGGEIDIALTSLPAQHSYEVQELTVSEGADDFGAFMATKRFTYAGEEYGALIRVPYGEMGDMTRDLVAEYEVDFAGLYFISRSEAKSFFDTVLANTTLNERKIANSLENGNSFGEMVENLVAEEIETEIESHSVAEVNRSDHILGNRDADIVLISYVDFDDPFSKNLHRTIMTIVDEYDADEMAWVYRNFPLELLHPNANLIAEAAECVADLEGNDAYWEFVDDVFSGRSLNSPTDISNLESYARQAGVSVNRFNNCVENGDMRDRVENDYNEVIAAGGRGTPYTLVHAADQEGVINGAQPIKVVRGIIDDLLGQLNN